MRRGRSDERTMPLKKTVLRFQCEKCLFSYNEAVFPYFMKVKCPKCGGRKLLLRYVSWDAGEEEVKKCSKCGELKGVSAFNKDKHFKDGLRCECRDCRALRGFVNYNKSRAIGLPLNDEATEILGLEFMLKRNMKKLKERIKYESDSQNV